MTTINRRDFMKRTAGTVAGTALAGTAHAASGFDATALKPLGATGIKTTLLGMGTGTHGWKGSSDQSRKGRGHFISLLEYAYDQGLRYYDLADMYGSHDYMKTALRGSVKREDCMLLTKTFSREASVIRADIERYRVELDTDYFDVLLLHCLTDPDWPNQMQASMDVLSEAKEAGRIRACGVSCHDFGALKTAVETPWVDVILARINPFDIKMDGPAADVIALLKQARAAGKGVIGMKILGEGQAADRMAESLEFVLGADCIDIMTIGFVSPSDVDGAIAAIANTKLT